MDQDNPNQDNPLVRVYGPESIDFLLDDLPRVGYTGVERVLCAALLKARGILDAIDNRDISWDQYEVFAQASALRKEWKEPGK